MGPYDKNCLSNFLPKYKITDNIKSTFPQQHIGISKSFTFLHKLKRHEEGGPAKI